MTPVAWLAIGEPHLRAVFIEHDRAIDQASSRHGIVKALVLEEGVLEMARAAYALGVEHGRKLSDPG